jgi:mannose-1-phosphate guanylyltransferase
VIDQAFVLAAGLGTRLRPLTEALPKPLLPLAGRPILGLTLDHLAGLGVGRIGLNVHHLADQIEAFLETRTDRNRIQVYHETEIKGTGGGLGQARDRFGQGSLLVLSAKLAFDLDLAAVVAAHRASGAAVSMVLLDVPAYNQVLVAGERIVGFRDDRPPPGRGPLQTLAYTSIQVVEPVVFDYLPAAGPGDMIAAYRRMIAAGHPFRAHLPPPGSFWLNLASLAEYLELHRQILVLGRPVFGHRPAGPVWLGPGARLGRGVEVAGFACLGPGAVVEAGARLEEAVILDRARVEAGAVIRRAVVGPGARAAGLIQDRAVIA